MSVRKAKHGWILTIIFTVISLLYVYPIVLVFINSFKKKAYISKDRWSKFMADFEKRDHTDGHALNYDLYLPDTDERI